MWKLLGLLISNHGYNTPIQKRFKVGDVVKTSTFCLEDGRKLTPFMDVEIVETGRYDYVIRIMGSNIMHIVYQFELKYPKGE